jgi:hypothetical protein
MNCYRNTQHGDTIEELSKIVVWEGRYRLSRPARPAKAMSRYLMIEARTAHMGVSKASIVL